MDTKINKWINEIINGQILTPASEASVQFLLFSFISVILHGLSQIFPLSGGLFPSDDSLVAVVDAI